MYISPSAYNKKNFLRKYSTQAVICMQVCTTIIIYDSNWHSNYVYLRRPCTATSNTCSYTYTCSNALNQPVSFFLCSQQFRSAVIRSIMLSIIGACKIVESQCQLTHLQLHIYINEAREQTTCQLTFIHINSYEGK